MLLATIDTLVAVTVRGLALSATRTQRLVMVEIDLNEDIAHQPPTRVGAGVLLNQSSQEDLLGRRSRRFFLCLPLIAFFTFRSLE